MMAVTADDSGNLYVADSHNNLIRKITADGIVTTLAGSGLEGSVDGKADSATFFNPGGVAVDKKGNVYVADTHNSLIRKISADGFVPHLQDTEFINPSRAQTARSVLTILPVLPWIRKAICMCLTGQMILSGKSVLPAL